jgi:hypothetical protein
MNIFESLGMFLIASGVLAFLIRSFFSHQLQKDIERFKAELQQKSQLEIEQFKSALELTAFEHQTRFIKLHEKRANIIGEMYGKMVELYEAASIFVRSFQSVNTTRKQEFQKELWRSTDEFKSYFNKHRIYFNEDVCKVIESLNDKLSEACSALAFISQQGAAVEISNENLFKLWDKGMTALKKMPQRLGILWNQNLGNSLA